MKRRTRILLSLVALGIVDAAIPFIPVLTLLLGYVLVERPAWFLDWVEEIYRSG